ncbi:LytR/AlgR family response regulator transcription factor [Siphonobacter aquaeclarae]|uniref:Two component transcriptional regulator, LytTR family n=1 Tax=Siphonobacter aquaeclarae TaxID=563176 RepID=A0A1G9I712_9BACT|nr:LytTR family DNA-binding domain-containing protein [Siphonobacter aquaeclarae]SDL20835.1 two component transcriptional regulator, LytTR family [Siphonobacter aquaeclarae]
MINCVIIDDEPLAREGLSSYVREVDFLRLSGTCSNPVELLTLLEQQSVDLLFLDIQMPKMSGIDFLKITQNPPLVVMTTAYPSFALEGFQLNVLDYLLKPITFDRFVRAAWKAKEQCDLRLRPAAPVAPAYVFIKCGSKYEKIYVDDILFIEGLQNYVTIFTTRGKYVTLLNLRDIETELAASSFVRVHKSFLVARSKVDAIEGNEIFIGSHRIPISRQQREEVLSRVLADNVWKK